MNFFNSRDAGAQLSAGEIESLELTKDKLAGFFTKGDLRRLISAVNLDTSGVQIYKCSGRIGGILASAINSKGPVSSRSVLRSKLVGEPQIDTDFPNRRQADQLNSDQSEFFIEQQTPLIAFFSTDMLESLFSSPDFKGVSFYEVSLANVSDVHLTHQEQRGQPVTLVTEKASLKSYLAVATQLDAEQRIIFPSDFNNPGPSVLSNKPTPGFAVQVSVSISVGVNPTADTALLAKRPYLLPWDDELA